jgi:hypothetical protein
VADFEMGCGTSIDLIVDDSLLVPLIQDVVEIWLLGVLQGYAAHDEAGAPVYILDGLDIAA